MGLVFLLHTAHFGCGLALSAPEGECAALTGLFGDLPALGERLHAQMVEQTAQSMLSPGSLVAQVLLAVLAIHVVIDEPAGSDGQDTEQAAKVTNERRLLWG